MVLLQATAKTAAWQDPPVVSDLRSVFASLDDGKLLEALQGHVRRGPKGHSVRVLWHCFVAKYRLGLASTDALIRQLRDNPYLAQACGIPAWEKIPHKSTFSRFFKKLSRPKFLPLVKNVSRALVRQDYVESPAFGQRVAMDSTTLKAWSNPGKKGKTGSVSDHDASWSVKKNTHGKTQFTYGWKLHLLVDCESELPIAANVSTGRVHDAKRASHLLSEARFTYSKFKPDFVMADKGYSGAPLARLIRRQYWAEPIIDVNPAHEKLARRTATKRATPEFKALYKQRTAVERVNSRLKGQHSLNHITVRGCRKVTVHCYLALITMQVA